MSGCKNSFPPKLFRHIFLKQQCFSSIQEMVVLPLCNPILLGGGNTGELMNNSPLKEIGAKGLVEIIACIV